MKTLSVQNQAELSPIASVIDTASEQSLPRKHWVRRIENIIRCGTLKMTLPDGSDHTLTGKERAEPAADIEIHDYRALRRLLLHGDIGFAEAYLEGEWSTSDLSKLFAFGIANEQKLEKASARWSLTRLMARIRHLLNTNSRNQAKKNIAYHYDLGNDFYRRWLVLRDG